MESSPQSMSFTEIDHDKTILRKLRCLQNCGRFCDVFLDANGKVFSAHSSVLAACSPYFDTLLKGKCSPKQTIGCKCENHQSLDCLLEYFYTGSIVIDCNNLKDLSEFSHLYQLTSLKEKCSAFIESRLTVSNCYRMRSLAMKCRLKPLLKTIDAFIAANFANIITMQGEVLDFSFKQLENLILNGCIPVMEHLKFTLICRWAKHKLKDREKDFRGLLMKLNWANMQVTLLYDVIEHDTLFSSSEWCFYSILQALDEKGLLSHNYSEKLNVLGRKILSYDGTEAIDALHVADSCPMEPQTAGLLSPSDEDISDEFLTVRDEDLPLEAPGMRLDLPPNKEAAGGPLIIGDGCQGVKVRNDRRVAVHRRTTSKTKARDAQVKKKLILAKKRSIIKRCRAQNAKWKKSSQLAIKVKKIGKGHRTVKASGEESASAKPKRKKVEILSCQVCPYTTVKGAERLNAHMEKNHQVDKTFTCPECAFQCKWNREYNQHLKQHFPGPPYRCNVDGCSYQSDRLNLLMVHRMKHTDERPHPCLICSAKFRSRTNLNAHIKCHIGEKPFRCPECERCFATKGTLEQHMVTHSDQRPYLCDLCGFSTKYQSHLKSHRRIHTGEVFKCQYNGCEYSTPKQSQLTCHMRTHLRIRSHVCSVCSKSFVEKSHLVRHQRIHADVKPFQCELCGYGCTRRDKLKEHHLRHHVHSDQKSPKGRKAKQKTAAASQPAADKPLIPQQINPIHFQPTFPKNTLDATPMPPGASSMQLIPSEDIPLDSVVDFNKLAAVSSQTCTNSTTSITSIDARALGLLMNSRLSTPVAGSQPSALMSVTHTGSSNMAASSTMDVADPVSFQPSSSQPMQPQSSNSNYAIHTTFINIFN